ncbi:Nucleolar protein 9 [Thecaphora frezii]
MSTKTIRKRGKKPSKRRQEEADAQEAAAANANTNTNTNNHNNDGASAPLDDDQPHWVRNQASSSSRASEAPFGFVDAEVKAYFRQVWSTLQELEEQGYRARNTVSELAIATNANADGASSSPLHQHRHHHQPEEDDQLALLIKAILSEVDGKELVLATDPDTSIVLEGLVQRIGQKPLRVLMDRMAGNTTTLACHRFGSHVLQTCLACLQPAITAEHIDQGKGKAKFADIVSEEGVLRSATHILLSFCSEIEESIHQLTKDAFGSHVLRSALLLLTGQAANASSSRSKRSAKFRQKKGASSTTSSSSHHLDGVEDPVMRASAETAIAIPSSFLATLRRITSAGFAGLGSDEVRSLAIDTVASPVLQLVMSLEAIEIQQRDGADAESAWRGSLTDVVLDGLVSAAEEEGEGNKGGRERSDHLESCLRDSVASHALQVAVSVAPPSAVGLFYTLYISGRLSQLGGHPAARHVVMEAVRRLPAAQLTMSLSECEKVGEALVKHGALGVLQALVERCGALEVRQQEALEAVLASFRLGNKRGGGPLEEREIRVLVPVILSGKTKKAYLKLLPSSLTAATGDKERRGRDKARKLKRKRKGSEPSRDDDEDDGDDGEAAHDDKDEEATPAESAAAVAAPAVTESNEPQALNDDLATVPGSLLLQTLARLGAPCNEAVVSSLLLQSSLVPLACHATASHVLLACLNSGSLAFAQKRKLIQALMPVLPSLVEDKWGSRVADLVWARADGFTKEKLTTSLLTHERRLLSSYYGGFFLKKLHLALFRKNKMREWREAIARLPAPPLAPAQLETRATANALVVNPNRVVVDDDEDEEDSGEKRGGKRKKLNRVDRELDEIFKGL